MNIHAKQLAAINLAIEVLERERRTRFSAGEFAHQDGVRSDPIDKDGVSGTGFLWAENDHREYKRYSDAIQQMEDLIEIMTDPGVTIDSKCPG